MTIKGGAVIIAKNPIKDNFMFKRIALASALSVAAFSAHADIVGGNVDVAYWGADSTGEYSVGGQTGDLAKDFGLEGDSSLFLSAAVEHPVPLFPNVKVGYSRISQSGDGTLSSDFNGQSSGIEVASEWEMNMLDATVYYEILDNWVNVDAGLTLRKIDSTLTLDSTSGTSVQEVDAALPLLYGRAQADLPFSGWSVGAELNTLAYDGDRIVDGTGYVQYESFEVLHARLGYRTLDVSISDSGQSIEGDVSGVYFGVGVDF